LYKIESMPYVEDLLKEIDERIHEIKNPGYMKAKKRKEKIDQILNSDEKSKVDNTK
jgi:hypothetical protein